MAKQDPYQRAIFDSLSTGPKTTEELLRDVGAQEDEWKRNTIQTILGRWLGEGLVSVDDPDNPFKKDALWELTSKGKQFVAEQVQRVLPTNGDERAKVLRHLEIDALGRMCLVKGGVSLFTLSQVRDAISVLHTLIRNGFTVPEEDLQALKERLVVLRGRKADAVYQGCVPSDTFIARLEHLLGETLITYKEWKASQND